MILAVKCAPKEELLSDVSRAGLQAVELYLTKAVLNNVAALIRLCDSFSLRYAVHAPNDGSSLDELKDLVSGINAEVVVFHNIYWEDEWPRIIERFKDIPVRLCIENVNTPLEAEKYMRRYGMGRCLDLEHLQMQSAGIYEEVLVAVIRESSHIHLSGYRYGSSLWHTHIHYSPEHNSYVLGLLKKADYSGFVVSEAKVSLQNYSEFKKLREFYENWKNDYELQHEKIQSSSNGGLR